MLPLSLWSNFYVISGSSAGALTGLMFVVITLVVGRQRDIEMRGLNAFTTPIVVQFTMVLLVSALLSVSWRPLGLPALLLGLTSLGGLAYAALVVWRLGHLLTYQPTWDDWLWHGVLPVVAYASLLVSALLLNGASPSAPIGIAAGLVLLLLLGIRNAWDVVTYVAVQQVLERHAEEEERVPDAERTREK